LNVSVPGIESLALSIRKRGLGIVDRASVEARIVLHGTEGITLTTSDLERLDRLVLRKLGRNPPGEGKILELSKKSPRGNKRVAFGLLGGSIELAEIVGTGVVLDEDALFALDDAISVLLPPRLVLCAATKGAAFENRMFRESHEKSWSGWLRRIFCGC
jgi:hypothetical protein